ncbi:TRM5 RNA methyltransferase [Cryptosporidium ubiquitum]|uniref:tRNA (guanine(37)-N1)-methyltransferase n=1 Tax=Cryptosporidium ubiquitum TaxID=857276 RepID=A0A1J4MGS0_9CRYT|nr:TRM5 RNA methyltransferase [Cryptosporidium ubiquitum]OII73430.1 TRM5 RNA methyltransferase [Cryptosporidium ubiquitum]
MEEEKKNLQNKFDSSKIFKNYKLPFIRVRRGDCNYVQNLFKENDILFKFPRVSPIINDKENSEIRIILMGENLKESYKKVSDKKIRLEDGFSLRQEFDGDYIIELSDDFYMRMPKNVFICLNSVDFAEYGIMDFKIEYKYLSYLECARQCIPVDIEIVSSFETVGHIAHLNLNDDNFEYRYILGKILLDKNPGIKTVVTKTGNIESTFRTYPLEVIAGENNLKARLKEQGIIYNINIEEVYWNSRLSNERQRIVELVPKKSMVFDLTCGAGAFTLPLMKNKDCVLYSNDLNPNAIKLLKDNILTNKLKKNNVVTSQKDCIECIQEILERNLEPERIFKFEKDALNPISHQNETFYWICNLPELSLNMLQGFVLHKRNYLDKRAKENYYFRDTMNHFFFYCFSKDSNPKDDIEKRILGFLEFNERNLSSEPFFPLNLSVYEVRDVSPNKKMYCAQFSMVIPVTLN